MTTDLETKIHDWYIDPREYARQEERRGRRHAFGGLDPSRTALLVVDMVPFFVDQNPYCRGIVPNEVLDLILKGQRAEVMSDIEGT